jgi:lipopolysaccharide/colanic/teichoic acid biosynthesis glycosyltransferase
MGDIGDYRGKRVLDVAVASAALVVAAPVIAALAIAIRLGSPGPALHRAVRVGRHGAPFTLYKLRSMRVGAAGSGPGVTAGGDQRVTGVGRFVRATKLDELPQLVNVLRGEMSLVGPRPEDPRYVEWYDAEQRRILDVRPGITSPASVTYRDEEAVLAAADDVEAAYRHVMAEKIAIDLDYFPHASLGGDLRWLWRTLTAVAGRGASPS